MGGEKTTKRFVAETYHIDLWFLRKYLLFLIGLKWRIILPIKRTLLFNEQHFLEFKDQIKVEKVIRINRIPKFRWFTEHSFIIL